MQKRVLLTGANGFVGRNCIDPLLNLGFEVVAPYIGEPVTDLDDRVEWVSCDLNNRDEMKSVVEEAGATHLMHLAWPIDPKDVYNGPDNFRAVGMSLDLFRAFVNAGGGRAVVVGTCAEYDWSHPVMKEFETPRKPNSGYGKCKYHLHCLLEEYADHMDVELAWGYLYFLYGPREGRLRLVPHAINSLLDGTPGEFTSGEQTRDFLHVADAADALVCLTNSSMTGPVNIASGEPVRVCDVLSMIGEVMGREDLIRLGARPMPEYETMRVEADVSRLHGELGWSPKYNLRDGLQEAIEWWRKQRAEEKS